MWPKITDTEYEHYKNKITPVYAAYSNTQICCSNVSNLFCFGMALYMFRTVFPSVIRSSAASKQTAVSVWLLYVQS